jgi:hypothetical protein
MQDHGQIIRAERGRAHEGRSGLRVCPRLEILETRCLMSDSRGVVQSDHSADDDARYRILAPALAALVADPVEPAHTSYVIVPEIPTAHSTFATAQRLPNVPFFGVIGTLGADNPVDLYQMSLGAGTAGVQFDLVARDQGASTPVQFALYDAAGRVLGTWTSGAPIAPGTSSVNLELPSQLLGANLYVGISTAGAGANGPAGASPASGYQLWVTRLPGPGAAAGAQDGGNDTNVATGSAAPVILGPVQLSGPLLSSQAVQARPLPATAAGAVSGLAFGSLPTRTAGLLGGLLASGDSTEPTGQQHQLSVRVTTDEGDRSSHHLRHDPDVAAARGGDSAPNHDDPVLVELNGPGGLPLLGTSAVGNWRRLPRRVVVASEAQAEGEAGTGESGDDLAADRSLSLNAVAVAAPLPPVGGGADVDRAIEDVATRPLLWNESRVTLSFGLSLATFLTLNVILSDPVAGFDYLATRLDSETKGRFSGNASRKRS